MENETILCIATRMWDSLWRDSQQIMSRIAAHNRVLYFEPGRNPDRRASAELLRNASHFVSLNWREVRKNLFVIPTPSSLPFARRHLPTGVLRLTTPLVAGINSGILVRHVRQAMDAFEVVNPILWIYDPRHIGLAGKLGEKLVCYYNYDELAEFPGNEHIHDILNRYDARMSRRADLIFVTSRGQWERRRRMNPNTHFIPNGVDFELFNRALEPATRVANELLHINKPMIGYCGWLGYQIDAELLLRVATEYSHCSLVLVGPDNLSEEDSRRLSKMPNVHFLGQKELARLPEYLKAFDVALIPYTVKGHALTVYPLKLHEYLASGRAIVATALPELRPYSGLIHIGETHEQFIAQIGQALSDNSPQAIEARVATARNNTWDQRVSDIYRFLDIRLLATQKGNTT